jgi:hypothetical protein
MVKEEDVRIRVILECTNYVRKGANEESTGISKYSTQKNRHNKTSWFTSWQHGLLFIQLTMILNQIEQGIFLEM